MNTNIPEEKKEAIINASIEEFAKHEYKHAILENIAGNANISKSLYYIILRLRKDYMNMFIIMYMNI